MLSMPPATMTLALPAGNMWLPNIIARMPEPHILLSVTAPAESGRPARRTAWRAGAWPWPAIRQLPISASSTASPGTPARSTAALMATAPSSHADSAAKSPSMPPMGVRAAETMTRESDMEGSLVWREMRGRSDGQRLCGRRFGIRSGGGALRAEAPRRVVREHVVHVAGEDALLLALPVAGVEQV